MWARPGICGQSRSCFFRLTAARNRRIPVVPQPRVEGRGCHARVRVCGPDLPTILGADLVIDRIILAGNKFGQPRVLKVDMDCGNASRGGSPKKRAESFS